MPRQIDWETIEKDWRAGIKTKLQMSEEHDVSRAAMDKHFDKLGIERDLTEKIRAKAEALVTQAAVTQEVTQTRLVTTEKEVVESNAQLQADIILSSRKDIQRYINLSQSLLAELEAQTGDTELFEHLGEFLEAKDDRGMDKLNELYRKIISTNGRVDNFKKLTETLKTLIGLKRQAFGIADNAEGDKPEAPAQTSTNDAARRIALLLAKGIRGS